MVDRYDLRLVAIALIVAAGAAAGTHPAVVVSWLVTLLAFL